MNAETAAEGCSPRGGASGSSFADPGCLFAHMQNSEFHIYFMGLYSKVM